MNENNQTAETIAELEIEFMGNGSDTKRVDPQDTKYIQHQYIGYGAFMSESEIVDLIKREEYEQIKEVS